MARKGVTAKHAKPISARLRQWLADRRDGRSNVALAAELGVKDSTLSGWLKVRTLAHAIDLPHLLAMAEKHGLSPNWLLLGKGPQNIEDCAAVDSGDALRERLIRQVASRLGLQRARVAGAFPAVTEMIAEMEAHYAEQVRRTLEDRRRHRSESLRDETVEDVKTFLRSVRRGQVPGPAEAQALLLSLEGDATIHDALDEATQEALWSVVDGTTAG